MNIQNFVAVVRTEHRYVAATHFNTVANLIPLEVWLFGEVPQLHNNPAAKNLFDGLCGKAHRFGAAVHHLGLHMPVIKDPATGPSAVFSDFCSARLGHPFERNGVPCCQPYTYEEVFGCRVCADDVEKLEHLRPFEEISVRCERDPAGDGSFKDLLLRSLAIEARTKAKQAARFEAEEVIRIAQKLRFGLPDFAILRAVGAMHGKRAFDDEDGEWIFTVSREKQKCFYFLERVERVTEIIRPSWALEDRQSLDNLEHLQYCLKNRKPGAFAVVGGRGTGKNVMIREVLSGKGFIPAITSQPSKPDRMANTLYGLGAAPGYVWFDEASNKLLENPALRLFSEGKPISIRVPRTHRADEIINSSCVVIVSGNEITETEDLRRAYKFIRMKALE